MKVTHSIPSTQARKHERTLDCPCGPHQSVTAAPGTQPAVTITHQLIKTPRRTR